MKFKRNEKDRKNWNVCKNNSHNTQKGMTCFSRPQRFEP